MTAIIAVMSIWSIGKLEIDAPENRNGQPMKTQKERCRNPSIKSWVYIVPKGAKYNGKNDVFNNFPADKDNDKRQSVFLKKGFQFFSREVTELMRYSSFNPINHEFFGGGARSRTVVLRIPLQVLIPVETQTTPRKFLTRYVVSFMMRHHDSSSLCYIFSSTLLRSLL